MTTLDAPSFDAAKYDAAARHYRDGRLSYSRELVRFAARISGAAPDGGVLDLGCGPGTIANEIAEHVGEVIGIDPSKAMIDLARQDAPKNVSYLLGSSEDLSIVKRKVSLVTFGRSFHWMDREKTLEVLDELVEPGGALAFFSVDPLPGDGGEHEWWRKFNKTAKGFANEANEQVQNHFGNDWSRNEYILVNSAFSRLSYKGVINWQSWTYDRLINLVLSRYSTGEHHDGDRRPEMERAIKRALIPYGKGPWRTLNHHKVIIARRA
ncbi:class I SAM-dependent methyltransferase [uncultured Pelagimonas sp.]|uniref:class I SAM-dependent methyltransferase n=1 Tax=uncultured Pelagimonas sp. TaxID=1618102 RepID=UPI002622F01B|nr:class I SAM-dependent methyltransferase [uncultured Pelagimonas sp.]